MTQDAWVYLDVATRRYVYRASSFGSCTRSLTAARLGESPTGPNAGLRAAMDASAGLEDVILARAEEQLGVPITGRQDTVDLEVGVVCELPDEKALRNVVVRGHPDGQTDDCIIEVKALGESNWDKFISGGLDAMGSLGTKYKMQGAVYGYATGKNVRFAIGQKVKTPSSCSHPPTEPCLSEKSPCGWTVDGAWEIEEVRLTDPVTSDSLYPLDDIHKRIRTIEEHAAIDELPTCDGGCTRSSPFAECHLFPEPIMGDDEMEKRLARFQELKAIIGSKDKGTGLLGEMEDISEWLKQNYELGEHVVGPYKARIEQTKPVERIDTKRLKKERPDIAEEYKVFGHPTIRLTVTGG